MRNELKLTTIPPNLDFNKNTNVCNTCDHFVEIKNRIDKEGINWTKDCGGCIRCV